MSLRDEIAAATSVMLAIACTPNVQAVDETPDHSRPPLTQSQGLDERNPR